MLTVSDLINIQYLPEITDISLMLLVEFYEQYLCKLIFVFELADGQRIKLFFKDTSEIFHVSGIDHIYENTRMDGTHFVDGIKNGRIDFSSLENINKAAYTDYIDRIRSFACIDTVLKNCEYLWFQDGEIPESTIKVKYLLLKGLADKNLHLGIDTYKKGRPYYSKTLLVTDGNVSSKYINKATARIKVASIEIIDKENDIVLEKVDRIAAVNLANEVIAEFADEWIINIFPELYKEYTFAFGSKIPNSRKKKEWISKLTKYLESKQDDIRSKVNAYDRYWSAKIVSEQIRFFQKSYSLNLINDAIKHTSDY